MKILQSGNKAQAIAGEGNLHAVLFAAPAIHHF
jgi:hypothetical protein